MDDVLEIVTATEEVKGASITLHQRVLRGEDVLIDARVKVAFVVGRPGAADSEAAAARHARRSRRDGRRIDLAFAHVRLGKPVPTCPGHALRQSTAGGWLM